MPYLIIAIIALLILAGWWYEKRLQSSDFARFSPPGRRITLSAGHSLYLLAMGEKQPGRPTVVLESGHGDWSSAWRMVMPDIAAFARVVTYDRAGFGWSDPGPRPRTPERMVEELHELLERAGENGPYVFVGHSMGGPLSRLYHQRYPGEVIGMVWVDSAHEALTSYIPFWRSAYASSMLMFRLGALLARVGIVRRFGRKLILRGYGSITDPQEQVALVAQVAPPRFFDVLVDETAGMMLPSSWTGGPASLGSLPVTSLEARYPEQPPPRYPPRQWEQFRAGWKAMQDDLAALTPNIRRIPIPGGHVIMRENPHVVIDAVREMFDTLRQETPAEEVARSIST